MKDKIINNIQILKSKFDNTKNDYKSAEVQNLAE